MKAEAGNQDIIKRLDVIIQLMLENAGNGSDSMTAKIKRLLACGLSQSEVAKIIGKPINYVTAMKASQKKSNK